MLPELHTLWIKGELSNLEKICLASMLKQGHKVVLHTYGTVTNVPEGVEIRSADKVLAFDESYSHRKTGSISLFADYFRCVLLEREMGVWVDLDCFLLQPLQIPSHGYLLGHEVNTINSAVLHLPSGSPILNDLIAACRTPDVSPYWLDFRRKYIKRYAYKLSGKPWHLGDMGWGIVGPVALTRLVPKYGLLNYVQPMKTFYPVDRSGSAKLFDAEPYEHIVMDSHIKSIHIYEKKRKWEVPVSGSFMEWATQSVSSCF